MGRKLKLGQGRKTHICVTRRILKQCSLNMRSFLKKRTHPYSTVGSIPVQRLQFRVLLPCLFPQLQNGDILCPISDLSPVCGNHMIQST